MIAVMLLLIVAGIALMQAVSDPLAVALTWLRLGGLIALGLLAATVTILIVLGTAPATAWLAPAVAATGFVVQLTAVQLAKRRTQRFAAALTCILIALTLQTANTLQSSGAGSATTTTVTFIITFFTTLLSAGLLGGLLMVMLLGHAYLTAGNQMTQKPFARLVLTLAVLIALRLTLSLTVALWPYLSQTTTLNPHAASWAMMMIAARYLVGLVVPALFVYMIHDCVRRRANQSATGILYVALILIVIGEGAALALQSSIGLPF